LQKALRTDTAASLKIFFKHQTNIKFNTNNPGVALKRHIACSHPGGHYPQLTHL